MVAKGFKPWTLRANLGYEATNSLHLTQVEGFEALYMWRPSLPCNVRMWKVKYLSYIQHRKLVPYRYLVVSSQMTWTKLIWDLWTQIRCLNKSKLKYTNYLLFHCLCWMKEDALVWRNSLSLTLVITHEGHSHLDKCGNSLSLSHTH